MYHDVELTRRAPKYHHFYVLKSEFERQMRGLIGAGYRAVPLRRVEEALNCAAELPRKSFAVTFDDGYCNLLPHVHPTMMDMGIPYTVFLVSGLVGKTSEWVLTDGYEAAPLLGWSEVEEMASWGGVEFQAHTESHVRLADLPISDAYAEMARSKDVIEQRLQRNVQAICYPYGSYSAEVVAAATEIGFRTGVTTQFGRVRSCDDPLLLPRVAVHHVPPFSLKYGLSGSNFWWRIESRKDTRDACR